jgi:N-carbamoylputrescine amidase
MVTPVKAAFVEWPEALSTEDAQWRKLQDTVFAARPDILVTNELSFGEWIAEGAARMPRISASTCTRAGTGD